MPRPFLVLSVVLAGFWPAISSQGQSAITSTTIQSTRFEPVSDQDMAVHWSLEREEVEKYRRYMALEGRYFYAHLDPVMVLGIIETDPGKRNRYAEKYLMAERRRIEEQTSFVTLVGLQQLLLYGPEPLFDFSKLPQAVNSPRYHAARTERLGISTPPAQFSAIPPQPGTAPTLQAGDKVDLLVDADCRDVCHDQLTEILQTPGVLIALYGRGFPSTDDLVAWVGTWEATQSNPANATKRIALKQYDPVVFAGVDTTTTPVGP